MGELRIRRLQCIHRQSNLLRTGATVCYVVRMYVSSEPPAVVFPVPCSKALAVQKVRDHVQRNFGLVTWNHVTGVVDLEKGQTIRRASQAFALPIMLLGRLEGIGTRPIQLEGPCSVSKVVADEVNVAGVNQGRDTSIEQVGHVSAKVLHPVRVELHVDSKVARLPRVRMFLVDM